MKKSLFNKRIRKLYLKPEATVVEVEDTGDIIMISAEGHNQGEDPGGSDLGGSSKRGTTIIIYEDEWDDEEFEDNKPYNPYDALTL